MKQRIPFLSRKISEEWRLLLEYGIRDAVIFTNSDRVFGHPRWLLRLSKHPPNIAHTFGYLESLDDRFDFSVVE